MSKKIILVIMILVICFTQKATAGDAIRVSIVKLKQEEEIQGVLCAADGHSTSFYYESKKLHSAVLARDQEIQGISCRGGQEITFYESGKIKWAELSKDQKIQGVFCAGGHSIIFYESGKLKEAILAEEQEIQGIFCAKYGIEFFESGKIASVLLAQDQNIQGILCAKLDSVGFYGSGRIREVTLAQDQEIEGIFYAKGRIQFDESGKPKFATLAQDQEIQGIKLVKGSSISFDNSGKVGSATLGQNQEIQGMKFVKGNCINFYESGRIKSVMLAQNQEIKGEKFIAGNVIYFDESGKLKDLRLARDQEIQGIPCAKNHPINFYESRKLKSANLAKDQQIQGILCASGYHPTIFYESGKLQSARLAQDQEIQEIRFTKGTRVDFYEFGKLKSAMSPQPYDKFKINFYIIRHTAEFYESGQVKSAFLAQDQEIQGIPCGEGRVEFYESGKLKSVTLAQDQEIQGIKFTKGNNVGFYESGKLFISELVQKYSREYDYVRIGYSSPKFLKNNNIVFLTIVDCRNEWGKAQPLKEVKITELNPSNLQDKVLFKLDQNSNENLRKIFDDFISFDIDVNGNYCILEPVLRFEVPDTLKVLVIDLRSKNSSFITRRGIGYRISPNGKSLIYGDMGSNAHDYSQGKTMYLTDLEGKRRESIYETKDVIHDYCWLDDENIAISGEFKEKEFLYIDYVKFVNINSKKITDAINDYGGPLLVSPDKNAILVGNNKLFIKKDNKSLIFKEYKDKEFLQQEEGLNGTNKGWDCYTIIAKYIVISSWAFNNEFTVGINYNGDLSLTDLKTFETKTLRKSYDK